MDAATALKQAAPQAPPSRPTLRQFMTEQADWSKLNPKTQEKGALLKESKRLFELAYAAGYTSTTVGGITVELGRLRRARFGGGITKRTPKVKVQAPAPRLTTPVKKAPVSVSPEDIQLLKLVADGKAALDLIAEAIKQRSAKRQELISQLRGL